MRLARTTSEEYAARLGRLGLRPLHVSLLTSIDAAGRASQNEHAAELGVTPGFVVRLVDDLERLGAVSRERDVQDRRRQFLILTPTGRSLLRKATRVATGLDEELTRGLSPDASTRLTESLEKIQSSLAGT
ncbi:MarR family winged helix-turn-helix transcriptional regulator [Microlunatus parietis]|uniref:DNA-binding MarR family transcriptional regulator n=1 Tax=Microlunatus parietis TaxID=682979 RepID=A0A7Y9IFK4_9ACTN|nr:MarR family transcriptional regulator [Microlunatus parietis]NYE75304.1 DNA-binding MarR family transcriptional regulator [Microlunatus parietis]